MPASALGMAVRQRVAPPSVEGDPLSDDLEASSAGGARGQPRGRGHCSTGRSTLGQGRTIAAQPSLWLACTVAALGAGWAASAPAPCAGSRACLAEVEGDSYALHGSLFCALAAFFLHEVWNLVVMYRVAKPLTEIVENVMDACLPALLVCFMLATLLLENLNYMRGVDAWLLHAGSGVGPRGHRPVHTSLIVEWLITVPMLLLLAGHALGRSLKQVSFAVIVTNVYICLSWVACFMVDSTTKWALIAAALAMYVAVSLEMVRWTADFRKSRMWFADGRMVRKVLTLGLIADFGIYGLVFLASMLGHVSSSQERMAYTWLNVGTKFVFALMYAALRLLTYHESIVDQIINRPLPWNRGDAPEQDEAPEFGNLFRKGPGELGRPLLEPAPEAVSAD